MKSFRGNGKLLLTGEYVVLDGALALAVPTRLGQTLQVRETAGRTIVWKSLDELGEVWFEATFELDSDGRPALTGETSEVGARLTSILVEAWKLNPQVLSGEQGYEVTAQLEFPRDWGLGSSSTLIYTIAQWFGIDPYHLLKNSFGGSGYDIAAAGLQGPFFFQRRRLRQADRSARSLVEGPSKLVSQPPISVRPVVLDPAFKQELFFVHLNRKQNSRHSIDHYRKQPQTLLEANVERISSLTHQILLCEEIEEFEALIESHETLISEAINTPTVKSSLFPEYPRSIKSLGGWGGDFVLATGGETEREYFRRKGYKTVVEYERMIL